MTTFEEAFEEAKTSGRKLTVMTGAFNNLTGTVKGYTPTVVILTPENSATDILIDRSKLFGVFLESA